MSPARRVVASVLVAAAIGGTTFAACRASDVTGPNFKSQQAGVSRSLLSGGDVVGTSDHDSDSNLWPHAPSSHRKIDDDEARNDDKFVTSVETVFPITEAVFNTCTAEGPILMNGYIKERMRVEQDPNDGLKFKLTTFKDTRGVFADFTYSEDYYDDNDGSWKKRVHVIRYRNRESLLDKFEAGPVDGLPFQSVFETKMFLQRDGHHDGHHHHDGNRDGHHGRDGHHDDGGSPRWQPGDDLFVFVKQVTKVGRDGKVRTENQFRSECK